MQNDSFSFPKQLRLGKPADFKKVFANPVKSTDNYLTVLAIKNDLGHSRLGLAIAKKNIRKAVARNLIKRAVRENFRLQQDQLNNVDIVVLARRNAANASSALISKSLDNHWLKIKKRCESY